MRHMRLTILGGGGFRVPLVYSALLAERVDAQVVLYDVDPRRLAVIEAVCAQLAGGPAPALRTTTDLDDALRGAEFIFSAIRVGGTQGRVVDERIAIDHGLLGQETIGPGGLAYALRTVPVVDHIANRIAEVAPQAWTINFTNPAGIITEAMGTVLPGRVLGICDTPLGLIRRLCALLQVPADDVRVDYLGLNHLGWLTGLYYQDRDLLGEVLADESRLAQLNEARLFGTERLRDQGAIPNEYLYYFEHAAQPDTEQPTRGEYLADQQRDFYEAGPDTDAAARWHEVLSAREASYMTDARGGEQGQDDGGGYHEVALAVMRALRTGSGPELVLGVANAGVIPELAPDAVIEAPCRVTAAGASPRAPREALTTEQLALVTQIKTCDRLVIAAARSGSRASAVEAFAAHPLVADADLAARLVASYIDAHPAIADILTAP